MASSTEKVIFVLTIENQKRFSALFAGVNGYDFGPLICKSHSACHDSSNTISSAAPVA